MNATGPRSAPSALPAVLGRMLASDYEHVTSEGSVLDRQQLLSLHEGRCVELAGATAGLSGRSVCLCGGGGLLGAQLGGCVRGWVG